MARSPDNPRRPAKSSRRQGPDSTRARQARLRRDTQRNHAPAALRRPTPHLSWPRGSPCPPPGRPAPTPPPTRPAAYLKSSPRRAPGHQRPRGDIRALGSGSRPHLPAPAAAGEVPRPAGRGGRGSAEWLRCPGDRPCPTLRPVVAALPPQPWDWGLDIRSPAGHRPPAPGRKSGKGGGERAITALALPPPAPPVTRRVFSSRSARARGPNGPNSPLGGEGLAGPQGLQTATIPLKFGRVHRDACGSCVCSVPLSTVKMPFWPATSTTAGPLCIHSCCLRWVRSVPQVGLHRKTAMRIRHIENGAHSLLRGLLTAWPQASGLGPFHLPGLPSFSCYLHTPGQERLNEIEGQKPVFFSCPSGPRRGPCRG